LLSFLIISIDLTSIILQKEKLAAGMKKILNVDFA
jgi:hypothetical protein